jgi:fluoride exporter
VIKFIIPVFVGGAVGAMLREFVMLIVPVGPRGFPYDILVANLVAAILLGLVAALHSGKRISDWIYMLVGVGVTGGLSTFSSFAYGMAVLASGSWTSALIALAYVATSLAIGYVAVIVGLRLGGEKPVERL